MAENVPVLELARRLLRNEHDPDADSDFSISAGEYVGAYLIANIPLPEETELREGTLKDLIEAAGDNNHPEVRRMMARAFIALGAHEALNRMIAKYDEQYGEDYGDDQEALNLHAVKVEADALLSAASPS